MTFNPRMLILARESRRMTQKALAEASHTTQASVSRAEAGVHSPQDPTVDAWATALRYPVQFFARTSDAPPLPRTFWRKQAKLGKIDQKEIEARIAIMCLSVQALVRSIEVQEADAPDIAIGINEKSAAEAARFIRSRWRVPPGPIEHLVGLIEANGVMVIALPGAPGFAGVSVRDGRADLPPLIFVSADVPADRQRWTLAHELGHIILHHHLRTVVDPDQVEAEADEFARELLMPAHEIRHQFNARTGLTELAQMKLYWRCSMGALLQTGKRLGKISDSQHLSLIKRMSAMGYRTCEPNAFPSETPEMLRELIRVHLDDLGYSEPELAQTLALDLEDVRQTLLGAPLVPVVEQAPTRPKLRLV